MKRIFAYSLILFVLLTSCSNDPLDITIKEEIELDYLNMDSLLFTNRNDLQSTHLKIKKTIPDLYDYQLGHCLGIGNVADSLQVESLKMFFQDTFVNQLENEIKESFNDLSKVQHNIDLGFSYLNMHLSTLKLPKKVVFMNSFFASSVFCTENEIGIGLERYLGKKSKSIEQLPPQDFFEWMKEDMDKKFLERDVVAAWIYTHVIPESKGNLTEEMISWGKILYLTQAAFPDQNQAIILRYSDSDIKWAEENLYSFWKYLVDEDFLFTKDERTIANMLHEGPFTPGLPEKGPDRLGQYLGWRMVKQYVEFNDIPLSELLTTRKAMWR